MQGREKELGAEKESLEVKQQEEKMVKREEEMVEGIEKLEAHEVGWTEELCS